MLRIRISRALRVLTVLALTFGFATSVTLQPAQAANPACLSTMTAQNNMTVTPGHGKVFYIDSGVTPKVDAMYVSYKVTNTGASSAANKSRLWVVLESFSGGQVVMASTADKYQQIDTLNFGTTSSVFFLLKAYGASTAAQTHTVKIYDRRPDLTGAAPLLACDYTFVKVMETVKSAANKINTITATMSPTTATLGGTLTLNVTSAGTGKIGAGGPPDGPAFWASPSGLSSWPVGALRLENTSIFLDCQGAVADVTLTDILYYYGTPLTDCAGNSNSRPWTAIYTFRIIGPGPAALSPSPVAYISSGSKYSHCDISGITTNTTVNLSGITSAANTITLVGAVTATSASSVTVEYTATMATTSATSLEVDQAVFTYASSMSYVAGSTKLGGATTSDPVAESTGSPPPYHFVGPYSIVSGGSKVLVFSFTVPCTATSTSYATRILGYIGSVSFGSSTSTIPISTTTTQSNGSSCTSSVSNTTVSAAPYVQTQAADTITSSGAVIRGIVNAYGNSGLQYRLAYSTDPNVVNNPVRSTLTSFSGSSNVAISSTLTGLSPNTVYYFKAEYVDANGVATSGGIMSFSTTAVQLTPTVTTLPASPIATNSAGTTTLNGSINPNLTDISSITFIYCTSGASGCTSSAITTGTETAALTYDDGTGTMVTLTLGGSGTSSLSTGLTSQTAGTTYYYKIRGYCTVNATYCPLGYVDGGVQSYTVGAPTVTTTEASSVAGTSATLRGTLTYAGTATWSFVYCASGTSGCSSTAITSGTAVAGSSASATSATAISAGVTGLTAGTTYYYQAKAVDSSYVTYGEILSFTTLKITTSSIPSGLTGSTYTTGFVGIGGSTSYTFSTASTLPGTFTLSPEGVLSGSSTTVGTYSITITMTDVSSGQTTTRTYSLVIKGTVTYNGNGYTAGTAPTDGSSPYATGDTVTVLYNSLNLEQNGFTFAGWNTRADGQGTSYSGGDTFSMGSENVVLYAQWNVAVAGELTMHTPPVLLIDPRATTLTLPTLQFEGATNMYACFTEVASAGGSALSGSTHFTIGESSSVANVDAANSSNSRTYVGSVANVQQQSGAVRLTSTTAIAPSVSRYLQVRGLSTDGGATGSCTAGGTTSVIEIRPYSIFLKIFQSLHLGRP